MRENLPKLAPSVFKLTGNKWKTYAAYKSASVVSTVKCASKQFLKQLRAYKLPKTNNHPRISLLSIITFQAQTNQCHFLFLPIFTIRTMSQLLTEINSRNRKLDKYICYNVALKIHTKYLHIDTMHDLHTPARFLSTLVFSTSPTSVKHGLVNLDNRLHTVQTALQISSALLRILADRAIQAHSIKEPRARLNHRNNRFPV